MIIELLLVFWSPPFVDCALTEAPLTALVPISISTVPVEYVVLERFPNVRVPDPEIVIFKVGRTRPVTTMPLMVPLALDPTKVSFQLIFVVRAPLPVTVPLPITEAYNLGEISLIERITESPNMKTVRRRDRGFILIRVISEKYTSSLPYIPI